MNTMKHRINQQLKTQLEIINSKEKIKQLDIQQVELEQWTYAILGVSFLLIILFVAL